MGRGEALRIQLRGHHLFCLLGYRGKGYSEGFCANMTEIYETLRMKPETMIEIVSGLDAICAAFPSDQPSHCHNRTVYHKDQEILERVLMKIGESASWAEICEAVARNVMPEDINQICSDCIWHPLGVCQEGIAHIRRSRELRELP